MSVLLALALVVQAASSPAPSSRSRPLLKPTAPIGSLVPRPAKVLTGEEAGRLNKAFARCVYQRHRVLVGKLLRTSDILTVKPEAIGIGERDLVSKLGMDSCLGEGSEDNKSALRTPLNTLRAMLVEEEYLDARRAAPTAASADTIAVAHTVISDGLDGDKVRAFDTRSDCVVRADAIGADALLRTVPGGEAERAAVLHLAPSLGACIEKGQSVTFTRILVRAMAAEGLWHRYVVSVPMQEAAK